MEDAPKKKSANGEKATENVEIFNLVEGTCAVGAFHGGKGRLCFSFNGTTGSGDFRLLDRLDVFFRVINGRAHGISSSNLLRVNAVIRQTPIVYGLEPANDTRRQRFP